MNNIHDPKNVKGMADLLADDDEDIDIDEIEQSIIKGVSITKKDKQVDLAKEYGREIEDLGRKFGIGGKTRLPSMPSMPSTASSSTVDDTRGIDDLLNWTPPNRFAAASASSKQMPMKSASSYPSMANTVPVSSASNSASSSYRPPNGLTDADDSDSDDSDDSDESDAPGGTAGYYPSSNARPNEWSASRPQDEQLGRMTNEERKQEHVHKVLNSMDQNNDDAEFIQQEDEEDEMARIMEQIDLLRGTLESEGVDLSRIPEVGNESSKKEAKAVLRILQIKNDRLRYCDFFEEGILAVAYGLESIFDGQREIFGSRVDLTSFSDSVKVKLRRMRYDTSTFISGVMQGYNISSGWRILLELVPTLFTHSRQRKITAKDNLISDDSYKKALQDIPP